MTTQLTNNIEAQWHSFLQKYPDHHLLQSTEWGRFKANFGWQNEKIIDHNVGASILFRTLPFGISIGYVPKGPVGPVNEWPRLWPQLDALCRQKHAIFVKIEPDLWESNTTSSDLLAVFGNHAIPASPIQPRRTMIIDLTGSPESWLSQMKQKTRYNIRLAEKKDITIQETNDIESFQRLMEITGTRNEFGVHSYEYYRMVHAIMAPQHCVILQASFQKTVLAAIMVFYSGKRAWYFYGASSDDERHRMPTYLLQFEAMRWAASKGCIEYDFWGIPDAEEEELENSFTARSDGLWGVYRFKRGFGGKIKRSVGAFDRVYQPLMYKLYRRVTKNNHD
ncbi:MAG: peptidoglycan bridge formation glycyltransferase FemA/FemB family protein [Anaerolineae bacterium]|nr:peptidoglycan bridge formation glycyltransferase FemA/FemB family protein [Anaerolineae bacterium]